MTMMSFLTKLCRSSTRHAEQIGYPYVAFGLFGIISYPLYYIIWLVTDPQGYENLPIRLIAVLFCIPLALKRFWPKKLKELSALYWYLALLYSLPFFFTYMLLHNHFSYVWVLNTLTGIVLSILLLDLVALSIILPLGVFLGWLTFKLTTGAIIIDSGADLQAIAVTFLAVIIFGGLFAHKKQQFQDEKLQVMKAIAFGIAHELRNPLTIVTFGAKHLKQYLPKLADNMSANTEITSEEIDTLFKVINNTQTATHSAQNIIDMLLVNVKYTEGKEIELEECSIHDCILETISSYPFREKEKERIQWGNESDTFLFLGNKLLTKHILSNLIKNALRYTSCKGSVYIICNTGKNFNVLTFKDTGEGIAKEDLPYIFDRFFTKSEYGTGLGLAYCKMIMESYGGKITCHSEEGKYTEFKLFFPVENLNKQK